MPRIVLTDRDYNALSLLVAGRAQTDRCVASYLSDELARAVVVCESEISPEIVAMNSSVTFRDDSTGRITQVTLVYPREADIAAGRISVFTPVGAALIGLSVGDAIEWQDRHGKWRTLTVLSVAGAVLRAG